MGGFHQKKLFANVFFAVQIGAISPQEKKRTTRTMRAGRNSSSMCALAFFFGVSSVRCKASLMKLVEWKILDNTGYERMVVKVNITRAILDGYFLSFSHFSHYSYKYHKPWLLDLPTYTRSILDG